MSDEKKLTPTARWAPSEPNIQNIPIRTEVGRVVREAFLTVVDRTGETPVMRPLTEEELRWIEDAVPPSQEDDT